MVTLPEGFTVNPKLAKQLARRTAALEDGGIEWGHETAPDVLIRVRPGQSPGLTAHHRRVDHLVPQLAERPGPLTELRK